MKRVLCSTDKPFRVSVIDSEDGHTVSWKRFDKRYEANEHVKKLKTQAKYGEIQYKHDIVVVENVYTNKELSRDTL